MNSNASPIALALLVTALGAAPALASGQECVSCWNESCESQKGWLKACPGVVERKKKAEEKHQAELRRQADEKRLADEKRQVEERRQAEAQRAAEEKRKAQEAPAPPPKPTAPACAAGLEISGDTAGHCCWPGQVWVEGRCTGTPTRCPTDFRVDAEQERCRLASCPPLYAVNEARQKCEPAACAAGQVRQEDKLHCCWPGQGWSSARGTCVGKPRCGAGLVAEGEACFPRPPACPAGMTGLRAGSFRVGETGANAEVRAFCLDVTEVTSGAYAECVKKGACLSAPGAVDWPGISNADRAKWSSRCTMANPELANHPVNCVDWSHAEAYCRWAGKRLPSDLEFEWAASGGGKETTFPWGMEAPGAQVCWNGQGNDKGKGNRTATCAVGQFPAGDSPQGVKDLAGNVGEWTATASRGPVAGQAGVQDVRAVCGAGWSTDNPTYLSSIYRFRYPPNFRSSSLGFRCAKDP